MSCNNPALTGYGAALYWGTCGQTITTSDDKVLYVQDINGPSVSWSVINADSMDNSADATEKIFGMADGQPVTFDVFHQIVETGTLYGLGGTMYSWYLRLPDGSGWRFDGGVSNIGNTIPVNEKMMVSVEITISGLPTYESAGS